MYYLVNNDYYFDSMLRQYTWDKFSAIDIAIVYPINALDENFQNDCKKNLKDNPNIIKSYTFLGLKNKPLRWRQEKTKMGDLSFL